MRNSQRVVAGALGAIVVLLILGIIVTRIAAPRAPELSGERAARTYDLADFQGVEVAGQWQVAIERGDAWSVAVDAPAELIEELRIRVAGGVLKLEYEGPRRLRDEDDTLAATITMPALASLESFGVSQLRFAGFDGARLSLELAGAGEVLGAASRFDELALEMSGAGNVELGDVAVTNADVAVTGAGSVTLRMAGGRLTGEVWGVASLEYYGTVSEERVDSSGLASVRRRTGPQP